MTGSVVGLGWAVGWLWCWMCVDGEESGDNGHTLYTFDFPDPCAQRLVHSSEVNHVAYCSHMNTFARQRSLHCLDAEQ